MGMFLISHSFIPAPTLRKRPFFLRSLKSSYDDDNPLDDDVRKLLESSWNADTMGAVPTNPGIAAREAAACLKSARENNAQSLVFVNLLLPSYDVMQGPNVYDDVLAVEFCIALAQALEDQACILVRDSRTLKTVSRVLEARERDLRPDKEWADDDDSNDDIDIETNDDFVSSGSIGDDEETIESTKKDNVDVFREQLMASWDGPTAEGNSVDAETEKPMRDSASRELTPENTNKKDTTKPFRLERMYRLASLFGDAIISPGPDMINQAVKAVSVNAQPTEDEETIIILSAVRNEEVVAVRSLAAKYETNKNIILVNCQFDPLPRELVRAITVYSILPLVARPVVTERNFSGKPNEKQEPPKVVVMRRYPKDWEVHVDANGSGFELADIARASQVGKKGPPMEWVLGCVKRHLQSKVGG
jgi:hypothetical protein